ncbi:beta-galactosidase [Clostridium beijerinckii]|uniref:beta-galactosidase n=1 Tax=Clostridium beijerinckii TaxID=1520 RepID=UPI001494D892|nr:beta-galactosidase [Clostridium beijerinckii]NOW06631.1 beta-galactosidase [Clostridium beijerinckii]NYC00225.1 beta-galactosidase [Clostridium beijerinckii]
MINSNLPFILYGGDYNPDQWSRDVIEEDMKFFKLANINIVTLPVFSWALLQPNEDTYNFDWLDEILDLLKKNNISVCLATSTAVQPAWMSRKYPEMLPVDFDGRRRKFGGRVKFCPNSEKYREFSVKLATKLAERYQNYDNIALWHIGNEYDNYCYCDNCKNKFIEWLKSKYTTLENLNKAWNTNFWGHTLYSWDEVTVPSGLSEMWSGQDKLCTNFQGIALDYNRFMSDSILECYLGEYNVIKKITPNLKITTNLIGGTFKPLDYFKWAEHMDVVSWDNYPFYGDDPSVVAMRHDLIRSLKGGEPFMLMEQSPNQQNWHPYSTVKRPGELRLQSYQTMAHGADSIMYFQMRQSIGCCEKYHGALISHAASENTRIFKDCATIGEELKNLGDSIIDSKFESKVAIIFDWDNWWAVEFSSGPSIELKYVPQIEKYYKAFHKKNIPVDFVRPNDDLSKYDVVVAPVLYMLKENVSDNIKTFVKKGGTFITTFFSGYVDENDCVMLGGYPSELRDLLGLWVEELDALPLEMKNSIKINNSLTGFDNEYECNMLFDLINLEGASPLAVYGSDFYKDRPVITCNNYGEGKAYYIGTNTEDKFIDDLISYLDPDNLLGLDFEIQSGVEITKRVKDNKKLYFVLNHNLDGISIDLKNNLYMNLLTKEKVSNKLFLDSRDVAILEQLN